MEPQTQNTSPAPPSQSQQFISSNSYQSGKRSRLPTILAVFVLLLLVIATGYFGYQYKTTKDKLATAKKDLSSAKTALATANARLSEGNLAPKFIAEYNNAESSRRSCSNQPMAMFDVHINSKFAVYRYLCANTSAPISIGALKKLPDATYEFTYGSNPDTPNRLPSYIYDTEPDFFGPIYKTTRF